VRFYPPLLIPAAFAVAAVVVLLLYMPSTEPIVVSPRVLNLTFTGNLTVITAPVYVKSNLDVPAIVRVAVDYRCNVTDTVLDLDAIPEVLYLMPHQAALVQVRARLSTAGRPVSCTVTVSAVCVSC